MENDAMRRLIEVQESLRIQTEPLSSVLSRLDELGGTHRLLQVHDSLRELDRIAFGPVERLRQENWDADSRLGAIMEQARSLTERLSKGYELPDLGARQNLLDEFRATHFPAGLELYQQPFALRHAVEAMRSPWLDIDDPLASLASFSELQGIGQALRSVPAFDEGLTADLRLDLGDWKSPVAWRPEIFVDPLARATFYEAQGLDVGLTSFPAPAFRESLKLAGLLVPPPPEVHGYGPSAQYMRKQVDDNEVDVEVDVEGEGEEEEESFQRAIEAFARITRFEQHVRRFIDERMTAVIGPDWIVRRVPGDLREQWARKRDKASEAGGRSYPLIAYADLTDYIVIITRKDNWKEVFESTFHRESSIRESLQRLYPIRNCTMHSRLVSQDDALYLLVETQRILSAIGAPVQPA